MTCQNRYDELSSKQNGVISKVVIPEEANEELLIKSSNNKAISERSLLSDY